MKVKVKICGLKTDAEAEAAVEAGLSSSDLQKLLEISRIAADKGGKILMEHYGNIQTIKSKGD